MLGEEPKATASGREGRRLGRHSDGAKPPAPRAAAAEAVETTEPEEVEPEVRRTGTGRSRSRTGTRTANRTGPRDHRPVVSAEAHRSFACFGGTATLHVARRRGRADGGGGGRRGGSPAARGSRPPLSLHPRQRALPTQRATRGDGAGERAPARGRCLGATGPGCSATAWSTRRSSRDIERAGYGESLAGKRDRPGAGQGPGERFAAARVREPGPAAGAGSRSIGERARSAGRRASKSTAAGSPRACSPISSARASSGHADYAVDCCGDVRIGGTSGRPRRVLVEDPAGGARPRAGVSDGGVATSGIGRRSWIGDDGAAGASPARSLDRQARLHRGGPGDRPGPDRLPGRGLLEVRAALRARARAASGCPTAGSSSSRTAGSRSWTPRAGTGRGR